MTKMPMAIDDFEFGGILERLLSGKNLLALMLTTGTCAEVPKAEMRGQ